jgi:2-polyprenyl-6-methoxyphenol hydroxylase-like FAD-dependent oxidoreductase
MANYNSLAVSTISALLALSAFEQASCFSVQQPSRVSTSIRSSSLRVASGMQVPETKTTIDKDDIYEFAPVPNEITPENPLRVLVAGAGVGGLALAKSLSGNPLVKVTVLERTDEFKRFGGPIQLASNALQILKEMDQGVYNEVMEKFTFTGNKMNGIKDGIRNEWYAKFDLGSPAEKRSMPYTGVIERPDLQNIYLNNLPKGTVRNGDGVLGYEKNTKGHGVLVKLESGATVEGDVLIGADGIWSAVRATMRDEPVRGDESGVTYSGYTVFAGELNYDSFDNGQVGYKVYIGPGQYFGKFSFFVLFAFSFWILESSRSNGFPSLVWNHSHHRHWKGQIPMVCIPGESSRFRRNRGNARWQVHLPPEYL